MEQFNPPVDRVKEQLIVGSIKVIETEYKVKSPVFEEVTIKVPVFIDEQIKVPVGIDKLVGDLAGLISSSILDKVESLISTRLDKAIDERISQVRVPKIIEEVQLKVREVEVERPIYKEVSIDRPIYKEVTINNPILRDVEVINALIVDKPVINSIITDIKVTNSIIKDVEVERAIIREKVIDVIHPRYLDLKGEPVT